jgi:DNA-binding CsgD family transcriptional regulator
VSAQLTAPNVIVGTPAYMSPEAVAGNEVGPATDLYALGILLFEMITGRCPFQSQVPAVLLTKHLTDPAPRMCDVRPDVAVPVALESLDRARSWGAPQSVGVALRTLGLVEGGASGLKLLQEAAAVLDGSQWRLEHAKALVELGAALRRANKRSEAREQLRLGLELAHKLGASGLEERAQTELAATGARPRRLMLSGLESLTPSERRVAEMAAENMTNKDIAQALFVTPKTVEVHLSSVYRKLEISSRAQLPEALGATA